MGARYKKKVEKAYVLEMSNHERTQLIKEIRERLQQKLQKRNCGNRYLKLTI